MIISHRGLVAAASLILFLGAGKVDGHHWKQRQATSTTSISTSPSPAPEATGLAPTFFSTEWRGIKNNPFVPLNTQLSLQYTIGDISSSIQQQADTKQLPLILMWTSASGTGTDIPSSENTWEVIDIRCKLEIE